MVRVKYSETCHTAAENRRTETQAMQVDGELKGTRDDWDMSNIGEMKTWLCQINYLIKEKGFYQFKTSQPKRIQLKY